MEIKLQKITIGELVEGYADNGEGGVVAYGGKLDVRPPYQREFVYKENQRNAVIDTVFQGFPLNVMYWAVREDGTYEIIDGQQRTISICQYLNGEFSYMLRYFHNLQDDEQQKILNYKLMIYLCTGTDSEKLKWFETINIAGEELEKQELRNAVYAGSWVSDAKRYFSKKGCAAEGLASKYLSGEVIRQAYLQTAIDWISDGNIEVYMGNHQHDQNANPLWLHFVAVIEWVKSTFPKYYREMKGIDWGDLWRKHHERQLNTQALADKISKLMMDSEVQKKSGIFAYVLDDDERHLNLRAFDDNTRREVYERQNGFCNNPKCRHKGKHFEINEMHADHIIPWSKGGRTIDENCQMLCRDCNLEKSNH